MERNKGEKSCQRRVINYSCRHFHFDLFHRLRNRTCYVGRRLCDSSSFMVSFVCCFDSPSLKVSEVVLSLQSNEHDCTFE